MNIRVVRLQLGLRSTVADYKCAFALIAWEFIHIWLKAADVLLVANLVLMRTTSCEFWVGTFSSIFGRHNVSWMRNLYVCHRCRGCLLNTYSSLRDCADGFWFSPLCAAPNKSIRWKESLMCLQGPSSHVTQRPCPSRWRATEAGRSNQNTFVLSLQEVGRLIFPSSPVLALN